MQEDIAGQAVTALCKNNFQFIVLNALPAPIKSKPSVFCFSLNMEYTLCATASPAAFYPAHTLNNLSKKITSSRRTEETILTVMR